MANQSERSAYIAPRAMRVGSVPPGRGDCVDPGSGDSFNCTYAGNAASQGCGDSGSSALGNCYTGSAASWCIVGSDGASPSK
jgi:hypothetical protein